MRRLRGLEIVARGGQVKRIIDSEYSVHSQQGNGRYKVEWKNSRWVCECPDYVKRRQPCKHIHAVIFLLRLPEVMSADIVERIPAVSAEIRRRSRYGVWNDQD